MKNVNKLVYTLLAAISVIVFSSCKDNNSPDDKDKTVHRTIIVYMAANNSLGNANTNSNGKVVLADTLDIYEMKQAAKKGDLNGGRLILYHANKQGEAKLYEVTAKGLTQLRDYADDGLSSINASRMRKVFADAKAVAPAKEYGLIVWSHGSGWQQTGIDDPDVTSKNKSPHKAILQENGKWMNITTFASAIKDQNFAFVYFDCCFMASVEVAYEMRNATPYIVGSVSEIPLDGMPYDENLRCLFATNADLVGAATNTYNYYNKFSENNYWRTCTMSVIRTAGLDNLAAATRNIYEKAEATMPSGYEPQKFYANNCVYFDLGDYVKALANDEDYATWQTALNNCIVYKANTPYLWPSWTSYQIELKAHCGLSTYIFTSKNDSKAESRNYDTLSWYTDVVSYLLK